jgi:hypothetical protein
MLNELPSEEIREFEPPARVEAWFKRPWASAYCVGFAVEREAAFTLESVAPAGTMLAATTTAAMR